MLRIVLFSAAALLLVWAVFVGFAWRAIARGPEAEGAARRRLSDFRGDRPVVLVFGSYT